MSVMESGTRKVLSYDEIVLYECDIEPLFRHGGWLTDNMVNFAANYLKNKILGKDFDDMICIVYATLSEIIKYSDPADDCCTFYKDIGLDTKKWCLFIFSDNLSPEVAFGGSHWCLVMFDPLQRKFFVFDSIASAVGRETMEFARKLCPFLGVDTSAGEFIVPFHPCPKMSVSGDCGLFVIEYIRIILASLSKSAECAKSNVPPIFDFSTISDEYIQSCRVKWLQIIEDLATNNEES